MSASLRLDKSSLDKLISQFDDASIRSDLNRVPHSKGVAALVAQGIADNFSKEGPGWAPIKEATMRRSVGKKVMALAAKLRRPARPILDVTGTLKKTVTTPGARGNIWRVEGTQLIWGTDLVYAGIHNHGGIIKHPGSRNGFGLGIKIPPHQIPIKKRTFLTLRSEWIRRLQEYVIEQMGETLKKKMLRGYMK